MRAKTVYLPSSEGWALTQHEELGAGAVRLAGYLNRRHRAAGQALVGDLRS